MEGYTAKIWFADGSTGEGKVRLVSPEVDRATRLDVFASRCRRTRKPPASAPMPGPWLNCAGPSPSPLPSSAVMYDEG